MVFAPLCFRYLLDKRKRFASYLVNEIVLTLSIYQHLTPCFNKRGREKHYFIMYMKRLLPLLALILMTSFTVSAQNSKDVNGDGMVNVTDVVDVINYILKPSEDPNPSANQTFTVNGVSFEMVKVEGGTFTMGATAEQGSDAESDEYPAHQVTLPSYFIGKTEVTQELWEAVMGNNPSKNSGFNLPVDNVTWKDCQLFISKLNSLTGKYFRLPTEAEWEYAARGGNQSQGYKYSGSNTIDDVAWYESNSISGTHPVATKAPNELGIYDMSGNVWEWCSDWYGDYNSFFQYNPTGPVSGSRRVERGGGCGIYAWYCRVSRRDSTNPTLRGSALGLRLAL